MRVLFLGVALMLANLAQAGEPPTRFKLEIDGNTRVVEAGQAFEIEVGGKKVPARFIEFETRRFDEAGVRFEYPRHFAWEHDPPDMWTLDGNNAVLILSRAEPGNDTTATDLLDGVAEGLRSERKKYRPITLVTRQGAIEGLETTFTIVGNRIRYEAYVLERGAARSLLMLQDSTDGAAAASEFKDMRQRLGATLEF